MSKVAAGVIALLAFLLGPSVFANTDFYGNGADWSAICRGKSADRQLRGDIGRNLCDAALRFFALGHLFGLLDPEIVDSDVLPDTDITAEVEGRTFCVDVDSQALPEKFADYIERTSGAREEQFPWLAYRFMSSEFLCKH